MAVVGKTKIITKQRKARLNHDAIRLALIAGEQSGEPEKFDFATFKRRKIAALSNSTVFQEFDPSRLKGGKFITTGTTRAQRTQRDYT